MGDFSKVRTAAELEQKYNLGRLANFGKNFETSKQEIIRINKELNDFVEKTTDNLKEIETDLDGKVTTYYYEGVPSLSNLPSSNWKLNDYQKHVGDLYFDQLTGYSYRFSYNNKYEWTLIKDKEISKSLAIANSAKDTADRKRNIFTSQPSTPYDNGDLWVQGLSGDIKVCQVSRQQGEFNDNDWIIASKYTDDTVANAIVDEMGGQETTVLGGQVVITMKNYAKFTDLATGGSTVIAGENITTGNIKSANYKSGVSGTNIDLNNGVVSTPNAIIDEEGLKLANGAKIIGNHGLKNTYLFPGNSLRSFCGVDIYSGKPEKNPILIEFAIPKGLELTKAVVHLYHSPVFWYDYNYETDQETLTALGYSRKLKIYNATNINSRKIVSHLFGEYNLQDSTTYEDTKVTWFKNEVNIGSDFTPTIPTSENYSMEEVVSSDFSNIYKDNGITKNGNYQIKIETSEMLDSTWDDTDCIARTGWAYAVLEVDGYMTYEKEG